MKIAVLFFGQPRFVSTKISSWSHKLWLVPNNEVDYFGHMWESPNNTLETQRLGKYTPHPKTIEIVKGQYKNIKLKIDRPILDDEMFPKEWLENDKLTDRFHLSNTLSQLNSISRVLSLVELSESEYDLCVLTRWDNFIWWFPKLKKFNRNKLNIAKSLGLANIEKYGIADLVLVGNLALLTATNPVPLNKSVFLELKGKSAEVWKYRSFLAKFDNSDLNIVKFTVSIIRSNNIFDTLFMYPLVSLKNKLKVRVRIKNLLEKIFNIENKISS